MKDRIMLCPGDTMTSEERLQAAINLQVPDRVPVSPLIYYFAAYYVGIDNADLPYPWTWNRSINKVFEDLGPWDAYYPLNFYALEVATMVFPMKVLVPGFDLPQVTQTDQRSDRREVDGCRLLERHMGRFAIQAGFGDTYVLGVAPTAFAVPEHLVAHLELPDPRPDRLDPARHLRPQDRVSGPEQPCQHARHKRRAGQEVPVERQDGGGVNPDQHLAVLGRRLLDIF